MIPTRANDAIVEELKLAADRIVGMLWSLVFPSVSITEGVASTSMRLFVSELFMMIESVLLLLFLLIRQYFVSIALLWMLLVGSKKIVLCDDG